MPTENVHGDSRLSLWLRVREYAVPASMIETATARRSAGDWAGACAAAGVDVDLDLRFLARSRGRELAARIRADLRHLAPDLLRWHLPRIAPDGLLRPGLTVTLARYDTAERDDPHAVHPVRPVHLVARTAPAWADGGQRISLALWDGSRSGQGPWGDPRHGPRPDRRFRLDLHRHLWDARRTDELRVRSGADRPPADSLPPPDAELLAALPQGHRCAVGRWAAEAGILLRAEGRTTGSVSVRLGARQRLVLEPAADGPGPPAARIAAAPADGSASALPVLPDAAVWTLPDLDLIRTGSIEAGRLHPLVASALVPDHVPAGTADGAGQPRLVECRGARHRIGLVDGVLAALDHDPAEIRREELLAALTGTPLPCLQAIDAAHRRPDCLTGVRERLDHGDIAGALAVVEGLLGPDALLRAGALRDELEAAALRRITYGLFRAGLALPPASRSRPRTPRPPDHRLHPRQAHAC
ncbi:hypothetical protein Snoj_40200 [Streptomyces nojiriensis]|uniref:Uncharacterized protein n=1 Tax=Streptomyces nojiriensis TaxID=66374 RepID=A0ABQ3SPY6_9ACTN|nr:hypothetical protein [Streptomyces nojiriensis]QTI43639.1 hypothetical protein JYK04_01401 [Streptomyces nojiriensis]GGR82493.1 hypothetical protein GCM10010205_08850 [Streptomyces nojiriensis]GHI70102.1 hypothetical protein Snoj_40200 [Streptomyces nojiriensis]